MVVSPGETVSLAGGLFLECPDNLGGCAPPPRTTPLGRLEVAWRQEGDLRVLGSVDPDDAGDIRADIVVPTEAVAGPAVITIGDARIGLEVG